MVRRREWTSLVDLFDEVLIEEIGRRRFDATGLDLVEPFVGAERRSTASVAAQGSITGRQVERRVRDLTGTSPKQLACLARFQAARDALWADPTADLCELAAAVGYADQSHMTRQFRKYAGQTPADFARSSAAKKKWLAAEHVAFVQEGVKDDA
jgi:AraC-like DNA-binding protein